VKWEGSGRRACGAGEVDGEVETDRFLGQGSSLTKSPSRAQPLFARARSSVRGCVVCRKGERGWLMSIIVYNISRPGAAAIDRGGHTNSSLPPAAVVLIRARSYCLGAPLGKTTAKGLE